MHRFDRLYKLHRILSTRRTPLAEDELCARLDCSRATLYRELALLQSKRLGLAEAAQRVRLVPVARRAMLQYADAPSAPGKRR